MQKRKRASARKCQILACLVSSLAASQAHAETEFVAHTVETYGSSGMCSGDALSNPNEDAIYFDDGFSAYDQKEQWTNAAVDGRDFTDTTNFAWGADTTDPYGTDFADVLFFSGHADSSCTAGSERSWLTMGDTIDGCSINIAHVTSSSRHAIWGGGVEGKDLNAAVMYACETTQYCVYTAGGYNGASQGEYNILNGFHGIVYEVAGYQSNLSSYAQDAEYNFVGDAWLDWMYDSNANGSGADNCPSAISWGANSTETLDFYTNAGWFDLRANGARTTSSFYRLCGCDPVDGAALPAC